MFAFSLALNTFEVFIAKSLAAIFSVFELANANEDTKNAQAQVIPIAGIKNIFFITNMAFPVHNYLKAAVYWNTCFQPVNNKFTILEKIILPLKYSRLFSKHY
jgi:hypothetical protein